MAEERNIEMTVIGTLISSPDRYNDVAKYILDNSVWHDRRCKRLWLLISGMIKRREHVDSITVSASLETDDAIIGVDSVYIIDCVENRGLDTAVEVYAKKMYERHLLGLVAASAREIEKNATENTVNALEVLVDAHTQIGELISLRPDNTFDINEALCEAIESIRNTDKLLIKTGFENIDKFAGGFTRGEITIVGGRPGHGKTTFLVNLLANMIGAGYKCVMFNRELPNSELLKKLIALESGKLSYSMIRKGIYDESGIKELEKIKQYIVKKYNKNMLRMFDNIRNFAKSSAEVKRFKPDVILDDYIQLINPTKQIEQRRLQLEALVNDYKWLAKETEAVVVLASQLNRGLETRGSSAKPQLSDLAESGAIEQVAENVFFTYYDYKINGNANKGKNVITIVARKVRYGETGEIDLGFDGDKARFYNSVELLQEDMAKEMKVEKYDDKLPF